MRWSWVLLPPRAGLMQPHMDCGTGRVELCYLYAWDWKGQGRLWVPLASPKHCQQRCGSSLSTQVQKQLNATLTPNPIRSRKLSRVRPSYLLGWETSWEYPRAVGSGPEDFTVTIQAHSAVADEPVELKCGASSAHAVPHLKNPLCRLHMGRALPKSSFTQSSHIYVTQVPRQTVTEIVPAKPGVP
ncbi:hypothetical protein WISP_49627 [Willisornis vidua]|uniref:Uncharacterized protein n=1 Tax=Willisornis vidua TaxID=1566151 RepID=A0ABQ9DES0_9PASS|nr:hypothetical protein WISP_49627 [Willisornis vidua]